MTTLQTKITQDLNTALKSKDSQRLSTLRLLKADMQYEMIKDGKNELDDSVVQALVQQAVKKRREAIKQYEKAGRKESLEKEKEELVILGDYLPPAVPDSEINAVLTQAWEKIKPTGPADLGELMNIVMPQFKGKNIDGTHVRQLIQTKLNIG